MNFKLAYNLVANDLEKLKQIDSERTQAYALILQSAALFDMVVSEVEKTAAMKKAAEVKGQEVVPYWVA